LNNQLNPPNLPNPPLKLPLWGVAQLEFENQVVPIRKKSLAILYYLALEGATSRDTLADLIWDRLDATSNLRVELHDLRLKLQPLGIQAFPRGQNPLKLPDGIVLESGKRNSESRNSSAQPMDGLERGLDQISPAFEQWLAARRRSLIDPVQATWGREKLIATLATQVQNANVLVLSGLPGFDTTNVVRELARNLNLSFVEGMTGPAKSLKFLKQPFAQNTLENIVEHTEGVVVVSLSTFGELPRLILELEEQLSESRLIYFDLKPLSWVDARGGPLVRLSFSQAAQYYLETQGNPTHLQYLLTGSQNNVQGQKPYSKIASKIQLEARDLGHEARLALERLSIQPGSIPDGLIRALVAEPYLDELERSGWLRFSDAWYISYESVRRLIYTSNKPGFRVRTHQRAARYFESINETLQAAFHRSGALEPTDWEELLEFSDPVQRLALEYWLSKELHRKLRNMTVPKKPKTLQKWVDLKRELPVLESDRFGTGLEFEDSVMRFVRASMQPDPAGMEFHAFDHAVVICAKGQAFSEHLFGMGLSGQAVPLEFGLSGGRPRLILLDITAPSMVGDITVLPLEEHFEHWIYIPSGTGFYVHSRLENGIVDLELHAYTVTDNHLPNSLEVDCYPLGSET
jgi:hypothetical protein